MPPQTPSTTLGSTNRGRTLPQPTLICALLALATVALYLPVVKMSFVSFDDPSYILRNPRIRDGLSWQNACWVFTHVQGSNWHPLTGLSHMLDCQLYGLNPSGHHLNNVFFHAANSVLLLLLLRSMTGALWRSAFVAALFALHPLHVESVAWVAERKDVLSMFFGLLSLWAYTRYAKGVSRIEGRGTGQRSEIRNPKSERNQKPEIRNPKSGVQGSRVPFAISHLPSPISYLLALLFFALGLLSKPMLVTLPFILLLLDYWPLERFEIKNHPAPSGTKIKNLLPLLAEKLPFFILSAASSVITAIAQGTTGAAWSLEKFPLGSRMANALVSYLRYLGKTVWPTKLAVIYPLEPERPAMLVLVAALAVAVITLAVVWQRHERRYLLAGWAWYLGTLVPVIGLVQVGNQAMADRYTYLPSIGLFIMLAWGAGELSAGWAKRGAVLGAAAAAILGAGALITHTQLGYWQNSDTLFHRALAVTENNYVAYNNLGYYFADKGEWEKAKDCYRAALQINSTSQHAWNDLGAVLAAQNRYAEAITNYQNALKIAPGFAGAHNNLGNSLAKLGRIDEAIAHYSEALRLSPESAQAHQNLAAVLAEKGQLEEAMAHALAALRLDPRNGSIHCSFADVLSKAGKVEEAVKEYQRALELGWPPARFAQGERLLELGRPEEAAAQFFEVLRIQPNDPDAHYHLALALTRQGNVKQALPHYRQGMSSFAEAPEALNNLAWLLATHPDPEVRDGNEAVKLAERACKLTDYKRAVMVGTLAAAYAEAGRFAEAVATAEKARSLAKDANEKELEKRNLELQELYRTGKPYREK